MFRTIFLLKEWNPYLQNLCNSITGIIKWYWHELPLVLVWGSSISSVSTHRRHGNITSVLNLECSSCIRADMARVFEFSSLKSAIIYALRFGDQQTVKTQRPLFVVNSKASQSSEASVGKGKTVCYFASNAILIFNYRTAIETLQ